MITESALENIESDMFSDLEEGDISRSDFQKMGDAIQDHVENSKPFRITTASLDGYTVAAGDVLLPFCLPETDLEDLIPV